MARIFITGSTDGLGRMAAELLIDQGHQVVLHARNPKRAQHVAAPRYRRGSPFFVESR
jgi:NAD(P)-dependent dehydrogenase (short-subunit alcohol dehydrogenase family)